MTKYKYLLLAAAFCLSIFKVNAQTIATIGDEKISTNDFRALYQKNNDPKFAIEPLSVEEYLDLFINFKLKVKEAEDIGMHTERAFLKEFNGYRDQLIKPYVVDDESYNRLIDEAYEHMKYDIRASHILINVPELEFGKDTITAWNKIMGLRDRAIRGENFNDLAFKHSEDQSARDRNWEGRIIPANRGDLGYFSAFDMIYPFEKAAYSTKVGSVSMPIRSKFGYHIIYVTDKIPAIGECQASHLLLRLPANPTEYDSTKIMGIARKLYERMKNGESFDALVKEYSDDKTTSDKGGKLNAFVANRLDATFIANFAKLQNVGDIGEPFFSPYGCHIVKVDKRGKLGTKENETENIKKRISTTDRLQIQNDMVYEKLRAKYNYVLNGDNYNELLPIIEENFSDLAATRLKEDKALFSYANKVAYQKEFVDYVLACENEIPTRYAASNILKYLNDFSNSKLVDIETVEIAKENINFKLLLEEYYDGILLFNINEKNIWRKAMTDSTGLTIQYQINKRNYNWKDRTDATLYTITDPSLAKSIRKDIAKGIDDKEIEKKYSTSSSDKNKAVKAERRKFEVGDNAIIDNAGKKIGVSKIINDGDNAYVVKIYEVLPPSTKTFEECKGLVISDYQTFLENSWLNELKKKYPVVINQDEIKKIK